mmetsp:Transcript_43964/g.102810  ORF Transcript_43964/g.102810 Transcript_43964/m.102810 type:complete len:97 (+) Transcript_43964:275-565(+)
MSRCLQHLLPGDTSRLNTMWATKWSSDVPMAVLWQPTGSTALKFAFVGGVNRCGAYCAAWGCGVNQTDRWSQKECDVPRPSFGQGVVPIASAHGHV